MLIPYTSIITDNTNRQVFTWSALEPEQIVGLVKLIKPEEWVGRTQLFFLNPSPLVQ